jgi:hypothetical protein
MAASTLDHLYKTTRWQRLRSQVLAQRPLCALCEAFGRLTAATVVDHDPPHRGDPELFWAGPFRSLCTHCHGQARRDQRRGYSNAFDVNGLPIDASHPGWGKQR